MIARRLRLNTPSKSNICRLLAYLTETQDNEHRVQDINIVGCVSDTAEWAAFEMTAVQNMNQRAQGDKTYHMILSFREDEKLKPETLRDLEGRVCQVLGFEEHQRVSVLHGDTDNLHLHICINKIHPERLTMHEPYYDHRTLAKFCENMEREYRLERDNHQVKATAKTTAAKSMEIAGDLESLIGFVQRNCLEQLKKAQNWPEMHQTLATHGLELQPKANGFVIKSGELHIKASSVDRSLSRKHLETRLGMFQPAKPPGQTQQTYVKKPMQHGVETGKLWQEFLKWREEQDKKRKQQARHNTQAMAEELSQAQHDFDLQNAMIKYMVQGVAMKRLLYSMNSRKLNQEVKDIKAKHQLDPPKRLTWSAFLQEQAKAGDAQALQTMRARADRQKRLLPDKTLQPQKVTRKGSLLYSDSRRDNGFGLKESKVFHEPIQVQTTTNQIYTGR